MMSIFFNFARKDCTFADDMKKNKQRVIMLMALLLLS